MRVTGGLAKGRHLKVPRGRVTRPTTDMVRNAVFALLEPAPDWSRVLDLFAGTGALGIEALSRGAEWADFVDQETAACAIIKDNLAATDMASRARVYCSSVNSALGYLKGRYGIVFMDPPYAQAEIIEGILRRVASSSLVGPDSYVVVSHTSKFQLEPEYDWLALVKSRRYGDTGITIYRRQSDRGQEMQDPGHNDQPAPDAQPG